MALCQLLFLFALANANFFNEYRWESSSTCSGTPARVWSTESDCVLSDPAYPTTCECDTPIASGVYNCTIFSCTFNAPNTKGANVLPRTAGDYALRTDDKDIKFPVFAWYSRWDDAQECRDNGGDEEIEPTYTSLYTTSKCTHYRDPDSDVLLSKRLYCKPSTSSYYNNYYYKKRAYYSYYYYGSYYYSPAKLYTYTYIGTNCKGRAASSYVYLDCELYTNTSVNPPIVYSYQYYCKTCFHKDTEISYEGKKYSLDHFKSSKHADKCVIPHVVKTDGVIIKTSCPKSKPLRLTLEHLVYTQKGLVQAQTVKVGDTLFADLESEVPCQVVSVGAEKNQEYYGLNCENSVVLADGYKTSTFGIYHRLPAFWMKYASKVVGVKRASEWGDVMARLFYYVVPH